MKYIDIGCEINCWECKRACERKGIMVASIAVCENPELSIVVSYKNTLVTINKDNALDFFNYCILDFLKPIAGQLIAQGKNPDEVNQDVKELAVGFHVARLEMLKLSKNDTLI